MTATPSCSTQFSVYTSDVSLKESGWNRKKGYDDKELSFPSNSCKKQNTTGEAG